MNETDEYSTIMGVRNAAVSLRAALVIAASIAFATMALVGVVLASRVVPITRELAETSTLTLEDYSTRTRVASDLDSAITDLRTQLASARIQPASPDSLASRRARIESLLRASSALTPLNRSTRLSPEVAHELELADLAAHDVAGTLLGVIGLIETRDLDRAQQLLQVAEALELPLTSRMSGVTRAALSDLTREEQRLSEEARFAVRVIVGWLLLGLIMLPLLWWALNVRLFGPLANLDEALGRIQGGDLNVELSVLRNDEIGRLARHFNHTTSVLRSQRTETQRAAATAALEASEAHYRSAFEQAAVGLAELSLDGRYMRINRAMTRILAREESQIIGHPFAEFTNPDEYESADSAWNRFVARAEQPAPTETRWVRGDDTLASVQVTSTMLRDADGRPRHLLAVVHDVTEQRRLERDLLQARKLDAVGQLAGGVAHDFNNLLTGIIGYAELMEHDPKQSDEVRADASAIHAIASRGADLSRSLLALARRNPLRGEPFAIDDMVRETIDLMHRTFDRRISVRALVESHASVRGDRSLMTNALLNLALNARDAMPDGGSLTITTTVTELDEGFRARHELAHAGDYVMLAVMDTGTGIPPHLLERLFEPFFTTKAQGSGTGLGLATAYGTVKAHGGTITVISAVGAGTTFTIVLPAIAEGSILLQKSAVPVTARSSSRILVVDDEKPVREVASRILRSLGYEVETAENGLEALARFPDDAHNIDLVLMDGNMPMLDGVTAARELYARFPSLPIIYSSGNFDPALQSETGVDVFRERLAKPYSIDALSRAVARCLGHSA